MIDESWLQGGCDIPFPQAQVVIHQPKVKDILMLTEENFYIGCSLLDITKEKMQINEDNFNLSNINNFNIFMSVMMNREEKLIQEKNSVKMILTLLFPNYSVTYTNSILLIDKEHKVHIINEENFEDFQEIIKSIFLLNNIEGKDGKRDYNPKGDLSKKIAQKLMKGREKIAKLKNKNGNKKKSSISRYISILAVGLQKDKNDLLNYTLWQLIDEFERFQSKMENDYHFKAQMAGAKNLKDIDPWMRDLYENA